MLIKDLSPILRGNRSPQKKILANHDDHENLCSVFGNDFFEIIINHDKHENLRSLSTELVSFVKQVKIDKALCLIKL